MSAATAAVGFSVHTGWAVMVVVGVGPLEKAPVVVLDRRRIEMIAGVSLEEPRFVYHVARDLEVEAARRLVAEAQVRALRNARAAVEAVVGERRVVAGGLVVGAKPFKATLEEIVASHPMIHSAEGELFREAIRGACKALKMPVCEVKAKELESRAAAALGIPVGRVGSELEKIGKVAGKPWAKDHRDACLAAVIALMAFGH